MTIKHKRNNTTITVLLVLLISIISAQSSHAKINMNNIKKIIDHKLTVEKSGVGVAVVVLEGDEIAFYNAGLSHLNPPNNVTRATLFEIGSITKTFTATALASMVNEGKIKLSDPIQKYLPHGVKLPIKNNNPITFMSLVNHSSGLPRLPSNMPVSSQSDPYADYNVPLLYEFLNNHRLEREVGVKHVYSNLGFGLLGHVLALIDKKSYQDMITDRVLKPLNMNDSFVNVPASQMANLSDGHNSALKKTSHWNLGALGGAGSIKSSIADMAKYLSANIHGNQLTKTLELAQTLHSQPSVTSNNFGLAWIHTRINDTDILMHDGGTGGFRSFIGFNKKNKQGIVILANTVLDMNDVGYHYLANNLKAIDLSTSNTIELASEDLAKLQGKFELVPGFVLSITHDKKQLYVQATGQQKLPLIAISATEFVNKQVKAKIVFSTDSNNMAQSLTLYQNGQTLPGRKL